MAGAISYAESTMGIVEYYKLGEILGEATAGTNGNVNPFMLPGGYTITWTGMKVLCTDDGSQATTGSGSDPRCPCEPDTSRCSPPGAMKLSGRQCLCWKQ